MRVRVRVAVGSDADLVVLDVGLQKTIRAADLHETNYAPCGQFFSDPRDVVPAA
jgi:hypothetical protein